MKTTLPGCGSVKTTLAPGSKVVPTAQYDAAAALKFLQEKKAGFPNYLLNESETVWQPRLGFNGPPAVFVFDRQGRRVGTFTHNDPKKPYSHEKDVVPLVEKLLKAK